ncbi:hypothetical protein CCP3SC1_70015 [Gammaproteobacteria bacterium]
MIRNTLTLLGRSVEEGDAKRFRNLIIILLNLTMHSLFKRSFLP